MKTTMHKNSFSALSFKVVSLFALLALLSSAALFTSGCSFGSKPKKDGLALIQVSSEGKDAPTLTFPDSEIKIPVKMAADGTTPLNTVFEAVEGDGDEIQDGQTVQYGTVEYLMPSKDINYSSWDNEDKGSVSEIYDMIKNESDPNDFYPHLLGKKVGSVILIAVPGQRPATEGEAATADIKYDLDGLNFTIRVLKILGTKTVSPFANGTPVTGIDPSLPKVTIAQDGTPSIAIPDNYVPPKNSVTQKLKNGSGDKITETSNVTIHYSGWDSDGSKFDSSWDRGHSLSLAFSDMAKSWQKSLLGASVGSQYLLIVQPNDSGEETGLDNDPSANGAQYFVIDILDVF